MLALFQALAVAAAGHSAGPAAPVVYAKPKTTGVLAEFVSLVTRAAQRPACECPPRRPLPTGVLAEFVSLVTDSDMFKSQLAHMGVDTAKMPLGNGA